MSAGKPVQPIRVHFMKHFSALWKTKIHEISPKLPFYSVLFLKRVDMRHHVFCTFNSLKAIVTRVAVLLVGVVMLLNLTQTDVMAANSPDTQTRLGVPNITESVRAADYSAAREKRREWQSRASSVRDDENNQPSTLGEKLNVDELTEGYEPAREDAKRSVPTP